MLTQTKLTRRHLLGAALVPSATASTLWDASVSVPESSELAAVDGVLFHRIKAHEPAVDGYGFLHGVALAWHKGSLYASFGHNKGVENTAGEEARGRVSADGGKTWGDVFTIDRGAEPPDLAVSHGVFHSHRGRLWAFQGAFHGDRTRVHTRAYLLTESGQWQARGVIAQEGFWPMQQPVRMGDGNWIMAGFRVIGSTAEPNPAAVAISRGDDFLRWRVVSIPIGEGLGRVWGESAVIVTGRRVVNIARWGEHAFALVSESGDYGRTWTASARSNLAMVTAKPCAGTLSNGVHYLIATTVAGVGRRRSPLTIALSGPGEPVFRRVLRIRDAEAGEGVDADGDPRASLSYPYAVEHEGHLYVGYSNNGGRTGMNINSAEMAVIPVGALAAG